MKFSYGKGSDSFVQRQMRLEKLPKCGFEWVSKKATVNYNDETHPKHKCKVILDHVSKSHRCNCGASVERKQ